MPRQPVQSSSILSVGYDARRRVLELEFKSGAVYDYFGVKRRIYADLMAADSKGTFVNKHIRTAYPFKRQ